MSWTAEAKLRAAIDGPLCRDLGRPDSVFVERPDWFQVTTPSTRSSVLNEIVVSRVSDDRAESVIGEAIAHYRAHGLPVKWCVGPWTKPDDFGERLAARGFRSWDVRGMVRATRAPIEVRGSVRVEPLDEDNQERFDDAFVEGWSLAPEQRSTFAAQHRELLRRRPQLVHLFMATVDDEPAGTTGLVLRGDYAYLVGAQILDRFRGRGLYRALVESRMAFLRERSIELAVTHAREATSAPMLEHLGFETVFRSRCYVLDP
jgi:hypothetical protein